MRHAGYQFDEPTVLVEFGEEVIPFESFAGRHRIIETAALMDGRPILRVQIWREEEGAWKTENLMDSSAQAVVYALGRVLGWKHQRYEPDEARPRIAARPLEEWHEDDGPVLWWRFPIDEPPWVGTPLDSDWQIGGDGPKGAWYTHWTPLPMLPVPGEEIG